jgi:hypothetical protein
MHNLYHIRIHSAILRNNTTFLATGMTPEEATSRVLERMGKSWKVLAVWFICITPDNVTREV